MTTKQEERIVLALESIAWDIRQAARWVMVGALAMFTIAGMNLVSFLVDWWRALFGQ